MPSRCPHLVVRLTSNYAVSGSSSGMSRAAVAPSMSQGQRETVDRIARALLAAADGLANTRIVADLGVTVVSVRAWRARFQSEGLSTWGKVARGRGRKASILQAKIDEIVELTLHYVPEGHTHWSCRVMAEHAGVSPATVQRIWDARGVKPHRADTFKLSKLSYGR